MDRNLSENSITQYKWGLDKYSLFNGNTLTELINKADTEEEKRIRGKNRRIIKG